MLIALEKENDRKVRWAIAHFVGTLLKHDTNLRNEVYTLQVQKCVFNHCVSDNVEQRVLGTSIFASLTTVAPHPFIPHIDTICSLFNATITEEMPSTITSNVLLGMRNLVPFIPGHNNAEVILQNYYIPHIIKTLDLFAVHDPDQFIELFGVLENLGKFTPSLLNWYVIMITEFCLKMSNNTHLDRAVRIRIVLYLAELVRMKKKTIICENLVEPIILNTFTLMAAPLEEDLLTEKFSLITHAAQIWSNLVKFLPPEKVLPPLLPLVEQGLQGNNPHHKKAAYLSMAFIADGCSEAICNNYLHFFVDWVKRGVGDPNPKVSHAGISRELNLFRF